MIESVDDRDGTACLCHVDVIRCEGAVLRCEGVIRCVLVCILREYDTFLRGPEHDTFLRCREGEVKHCKHDVIL